MVPEGEEEAGVDPVVGVARGPVEAEERDLGDAGGVVHPEIWLPGELSRL